MQIPQQLTFTSTPPRIISHTRHLPRTHTQSSPRSTPVCQGTFPRRKFVSLAALATLSFPLHAKATNGLHIFPLNEPLVNTYYLMRSAETISDSKQVIATNPVEKISLSKHSLTPRGVQQAMSAADALMRSGVKSDAWIWPSVTISAFETAEVVASKLRVRREQIVPEFSFLDARGVGALEGGDVTEVRDLLRKHDALDSNWKPVPGEDGTPNDSVEDVFVRVRQLISKLETQYFGETVVIVAPDSDPLTVLQTALTGRDVCTLHECEYEPGEVRRVSEMVMDQFGNVTTHGKVDVVFGGQA